MKRILIGFLLLSIGTFGLMAQDMPCMIMADSIYNTHQYEASIPHYEKAFSKDAQNYDVLWKYSRALVDAGELVADEDKQKELYAKAVEMAEKAIAVNPEGWEGHLYAGVSYGRKALAAGAKERVKLSKQVRAEAEKTIEMNPDCDIAYHVLARWHRKITSLSWIEKKFANMFLGGIPGDASKEEAVKLFTKAIEIKPDYINHRLELGITLEEMKKYEDARKALREAIALAPKSPRDENYQQTARKLLEKIKDKH
jgi:tetratricopeptide (TPR) repeat protein